MTGQMEGREIDQAGVRGSKTVLSADEKTERQLADLMRWCGCSRSEAVRMSIRYAFASKAVWLNA